MKRNFEDISNLRIIYYIQNLFPEELSKLNIHISCGTVYRIIRDRVFFVNNDKYYNVGIEGFKNEDLIIILRYLENFQKSRDIVRENAIIGETYDKKNSFWRKEIMNKKNVEKLVKEFLSRKKNRAFVDSRKPQSEENITYVGKFIKNRLTDLYEKFHKFSDVIYDKKNRKFVIIIGKYGETTFDINLLHLLDEVKSKFKKDCVIYSLSDYGRIYNKISNSVLYF